MMYGLTEKQFRLSFERAKRMGGVAGDNFLRILETRLDNVVYRLGFANSRSAARQLVSHGHIRVDGHKVDVPSFAVRPGAKIEVRDRTSSKQLATRAVEEGQGRTPPAWLVVLPEQLSGQAVREPAKEELPADVNVQIIVEFYSR
jgi:small subunit ribosomal protein S4